MDLLRKLISPSTESPGTPTISAEPLDKEWRKQSVVLTRRSRPQKKDVSRIDIADQYEEVDGDYEPKEGAPLAPLATPLPKQAILTRTDEGKWIIKAVDEDTEGLE